MKTYIAALMLLLVVNVDAMAVTIDWLPVGNPGNANDTADGDSFIPGIQSFGAVPYSYSIGKYDVTNSQYVEFLNAKDPTATDSLGLTFGDPRPEKAIRINPMNADGSKYFVVAGSENIPAVYVSWYSAIRFANWMSNGQGNGDTETGAYTLLHAGSPAPTRTPSNGGSITRNAGAPVVLPSENEWYKAAFYDSGTDSYFKYPTSSNTVPIASAPTALPNHANLDGFMGGVTEVGAYTGTTSPYGAFDMGGNVFQWNESLEFGGYRVLRGEGWEIDLGLNSGLSSSDRSYSVPDESGYNAAGFRLANVPEPSMLALSLFALAGLAALAIRKRRVRCAP